VVLGVAFQEKSVRITADRESHRVERVVEGAVGASDRYGQQNLPGAKGPCFVRVWVDEESVHGQSRAPQHWDE
jgi:hypothetical protein